jgi:tRNA (guanine37-N1)-methyltransferase
MRIDILTVVPELLDSPLSHSIVGRAISKGLVEIHVHNLRKYGKGPRQQVDDYSYGGDAGMVLMLEPVYNMIEELKAEMQKAARELRFEEAAFLRDRIRILETTK